MSRAGGKETDRLALYLQRYCHHWYTSEFHANIGPNYRFELPTPIGLADKELVIILYIFLGLWKMCVNLS